MENIKEYFKKKLSDGYEDYEIVIALLALLEEDKIMEKDLLPILNYVFSDDAVKVYNALNRAHAVVDDKLIEDILEEVDLNK
jgi:hypothetical protein